MSKRGLTARELVNLRGAYPTLVFDADQWGEHGFFYDPVDRQFASYAIDRKDQTDEVDKIDTADPLFERCASERRPELQAWLDSFRIGTSGDETFLWYPATKQLARFRLVVPPEIAIGEQAALAAMPEDYSRAWLKQQLTP
jgi:hypothetical protein